MTLSEDQFYELWERFAASTIMESLPDDVEEVCSQCGITVDYFLMEFV
jgi:hypothetical protein